MHLSLPCNKERNISTLNISISREGLYSGPIEWEGLEDLELEERHGRGIIKDGALLEISYYLRKLTGIRIVKISE